MSLQVRSLTAYESDSTSVAYSPPAYAAQKINRGILFQFLFTFFSNWLLFGIFFAQGVLLARFLGAQGRGEFGTVLFFPRDLLLYVGMFGAAEVITALAGRYREIARELRFAGIRLGLLTGLLTIVAAIALAACFLIPSGKGNLVGLVALTALFLPLEHVQIIASGVDRGRGDFVRYNLNRLFFGLSFPALLLLWIICGGRKLWLGHEIQQVCLLFLASRLMGLIPTILTTNTGVKESREPTEISLLDKLDLRPTHLLGIGRGYGWSMLASECFERLDILLIVLLADFSEAGNYFVAIPAATLVTLLPNAAGLFAFNAGNNSEFRPRKINVLAFLLAALCLQAIVATVLWLVLPELIRILFGSGFELAITFAIWLLPCCALKGYVQLVDGFLKGRGYAMVGVWTRIASVFLMLLAVWLLFPTLQLYAVPAGAFIGQLLVAFVLSGYCLQADAAGSRNPGDVKDGGHG